MSNYPLILKNMHHIYLRSDYETQITIEIRTKEKFIKARCNGAPNLKSK